MKALWNNTVIAESDNTVVIEGNHYFPPDSVNADFLVKSQHTSLCHWKGTAHYYSVEVGNKINENAAWYYPEPKAAADEIRGYVAFWKGVEVTA